MKTEILRTFRRIQNSKTATKKPLGYVPLNPGCLIGILVIVPIICAWSKVAILGMVIPPFIGILIMGI